jgi:hypothetical protein
VFWSANADNERAAVANVDVEEPHPLSWEGLTQRAKFLSFLAICIAMDAAFVVAWIVVIVEAQPFASWARKKAPHATLLIALVEWAFYIATLAILTTWLVKDVRKCAARIWAEK